MVHCGMGGWKVDVVTRVHVTIGRLEAWDVELRTYVLRVVFVEGEDFLGFL